MSNYGLEKFLKRKNKILDLKLEIDMLKKKMKKFNFNLGGEQSGHIILVNLQQQAMAY